MHLKTFKARPFLIAFALLLPCILLSFGFLSVSMTPPSIGSHSAIVETHVPASTGAANLERSGMHQDGHDCGGIIAVEGIGMGPLAIWSGKH
jgi:hypothetical protein